MTREFGATAWGRAWLKQIEPVLITGAPDRDLPRARALARHAITDLTITGRRVTASITDCSHGQTLALDIPAWSGDEQRTVERALTSTGSLHAGDLPDRLATDLTAAGVRIAPWIEEIAAAGDTGRIERRHVLAVCYALVQRIDEEPVLAVRLRTPSETSPSTVKSSPAGLLALTDIDPKTFYLVPTVRDRRNAASR